MTLEVQNLTKKFGPVTAAEKITFKADKGEIFALIGPNGSGKTTIIKLITGILRSTVGKAVIGGFDAAREPVKAKGQIGYIPDDPAVWPEMTGEEFLNFSGTLYGVTESERRHKIPQLLKVFGLEGIEKGYFEDYSRGSKQKFSILAALLHNPKLLLVDEPIIGLDPESAETAKRQFADFAKKGGTVVLATHTLSVAQEIATRIGILKEGRLIKTGTFKELQRQARLKADSSLEDVYMAFVHSRAGN